MLVAGPQRGAGRPRGALRDDHPARLFFPHLVRRKEEVGDVQIQSRGLQRDPQSARYGLGALALAPSAPADVWVVFCPSAPGGARSRPMKSTRAVRGALADAHVPIGGGRTAQQPTSRSLLSTDADTLRCIASIFVVGMARSVLPSSPMQFVGAPLRLSSGRLRHGRAESLSGPLSSTRIHADHGIAQDCTRRSQRDLLMVCWHTGRRHRGRRLTLSRHLKSQSRSRTVFGRIGWSRLIGRSIHCRLIVCQSRLGTAPARWLGAMGRLGFALIGLARRANIAPRVSRIAPHTR